MTIDQDTDDLTVYGEEGHGDDAAGRVVSGAVSLSPGGTLNEESLERFLLGRHAQIVTIIGDRDSGKSTLISAIYDRLLRGPFAGFSFVASRSLIAFEKRLHSARVESGRNRPETPRTSRQEGLLHFHIALAETENPDGRFDIMLSDRAGEVYREARGDTALISQLPEIFRADRLVILVDGGRLASPIERSNAVQSARQMLRALLDNDAIDSESRVQIVITKMDLLDSTQDEDLGEIVANFEAKLLADFGQRLPHLQCMRVCARDPDGKLDPALGVDSLLHDWSVLTEKVVVPHVPELKLTSEFDRLLLRMPKDMMND
ncbi:hypothetical protein GCM10007989_14140 [Devosia pacifica]|uniref:Double-GTPase 2 domain-containing protein n=1 Tax=Devosia pacifica TaxID=1335967 RepID=A0A918VSV0_9HYPH|nr:hypothetical protein [Devosia pacifica]GHA19708.1 hypothetical protein GCM10007989_14140 [Devosia pacifica]